MDRHLNFIFSKVFSTRTQRVPRNIFLKLLVELSEYMGCLARVGNRNGKSNERNDGYSKLIARR